MLPVSAIAITKAKGQDFLYVENGRVPLWDDYVQAYEYARLHNIKPAVVYDFRSLEHAVGVFGDVFTDGGSRNARTHTEAGATDCY